MTSDYKKISKVAIHRIFSATNPCSREIPRIFIFDCCSGDQDRDSTWRGVTDSEESSSEEESIQEKGKNVIQIDQGKEYNVDDVEISDVLWAYGEKNPDFRLAVINAANEGFQAKMSCESGSYTITKITEKISDNVSNRNELSFGDILDEAQDELGDKQLMTMTLNNKTQYIAFLRNGTKSMGKNILKYNQVSTMEDENEAGNETHHIV